MPRRTAVVIVTKKFFLNSRRVATYLRHLRNHCGGVAS